MGYLDDRIEVQRDCSDRLVVECSRCHKATVDAKDFCCSWAASMFLKYFVDSKLGTEVHRLFSPRRDGV